MNQVKFKFYEKKAIKEEKVNMVNSNPPYQEIVKLLTIFYKEKVSHKQSPGSTTPQKIVEALDVFSYHDNKAIS